MQYVSSSPSKIPYVGFSPVRLQTGIGPRSSHTQDGLSARPAFTHPGQTYTWSKLSPQKGNIPQLYSRFFRNGDKAQPDLPSILMSSNPVQRPLARRRVMLSLRVNAYYGLIRNSQPLPSTYGLYDGSLSYGLVWTGIERLPNLLRVSFSSVPPSGPRRTKRLQSTVASSLILAFAPSAWARHPQFRHAGSEADRVTRLQSSLKCYGPAGLLALHRQGLLLPSFHPPKSPQEGVGYNYTGKQSIPVIGLSPIGHAALWAANGWTRINTDKIGNRAKPFAIRAKPCRNCVSAR
jgi:hypothetical protein